MNFKSVQFFFVLKAFSCPRAKGSGHIISTLFQDSKRSVTITWNKKLFIGFDKIEKH